MLIIECLRATIALVPLRVKFSSMSESKTSQADLCYVKRCSCVVFSLKAQRKSTPHPIPPSLHISFIQIQHFFRREEQWGVGCVCGGGGGWWGERTLGLFVKSFLPAFTEKQHRNICSHHTSRLAKFGWILTYLKISLQMAHAIVARSLSIVQDFQ